MNAQHRLKRLVGNRIFWFVATFVLALDLGVAISEGKSPWLFAIGGAICMTMGIRK